jgi:predicted nucleic acid-binding protein
LTTPVIDTSALVKYVLPEEDSSAAEKLVASHHAGMVNLIAPEYILVESANVLWKHLQRHNVRPEEAVTSFRALTDLGMRLVPNGDLLEDALILAADNGITVYDALFCALAVRENVPLITSDNALVRRLTGTGVQAAMLSEWNDGG